MKRAIIAPVPLPASALAELKQWLGINTTREDALLTALLHAALDICESYTGLRPIEAYCEEIWPTRTETAPGQWQKLSTRPVQRIASIETVSPDGVRALLPSDSCAMELDADGTGRFRIMDAHGARRVAVHFTAGMAPGWNALPDALRQGVLRLAAHHHRARDTGDGTPAPPMAVTALWHPWRRMRLI